MSATNIAKKTALMMGLAFQLIAQGQRTAESSRMVTFAAVGDTMIGSVFPSTDYLPKHNGTKAFDRVKHLWEGADVVAANFEGAVAETAAEARPVTGPNSYRYLVPASSVLAYKTAGFTVLNVANNHALDAGQRGIEQTAKAMDAAGIAFAGSLERPTTILKTKAGVKIGFIGVAPHQGCFPMEVAGVLAKVRELKSPEGGACAIVIVSMHAGAEGSGATHVPKRMEHYLGYQRGDVYAFAHSLIDGGVDLVFGHGPHVLRGVEIYKKRLIAYSLGNFATNGAFNLKGTSGIGAVLVARLTSTGELIDYEIKSTFQSKDTEVWAEGIPVQPDPEDRGRLMIERLSREDFRASTEEQPLLPKNIVLPEQAKTIQR
jgi:poly-gamma-glutamate capsule biosynthesis protein CapA/YwtB (metallophosphatase superfamily)